MKRMILDCDPGHDDMVAIMLALASPELELLGITTVAGNQTGEKTFRNACRILKLVGREDVPLFRGSDQPLVRPLLVAEDIHGSTGLDGVELPEADTSKRKGNAIDFIVDTVNASKEPMHLVATGPLTNVAIAFRKDPGITRRIERLTIMGGGVYDSNVTPSAEFNIYVDPEAARAVFHCGVPITLVTLDISNKALFTDKEIGILESMGGAVSSKVAPLLRFFMGNNLKKFGIPGAALHDPLTVASLIDPGLITTRDLYVDVECAGELTRGETVADVYGVTGHAPNMKVSRDFNLAGYRTLIIDAIRTLDAGVSGRR
ncbi:MAG TPA: nucleoside hydrolase [Spirochaetia bacterium]|nr:nucleoside hydrolase [Spirochaetia bacterium]